MTLSRLTTHATPFAHLDRLTDDRGLFEHSLFDAPREEHGYCVDDAARALLITSREPSPTTRVREMAEVYLGFVERAIQRDGRAHNRMDTVGRWTDAPGVGDWWGRALRALGTVASRTESPRIRTRALRAFNRAAQQDSQDLRAIAFGALGASEILAVAPRLASARKLIFRAAAMIPTAHDPEWPWPEPRLRYSNGVIPEALIAGGAAVHDRGLTARGLLLLEFLLASETVDGRLSVTGLEGRDPGEDGPLFDQLPIEASAIADACARAYDITGEDRWLDGLRLAWEWFLGNNDSGTAMIDAETGAGYDGLTPDGRNENRGAESTLAALSTFQQARRLLGAALP